MSEGTGVRSFSLLRIVRGHAVQWAATRATSFVGRVVFTFQPCTECTFRSIGCPRPGRSCGSDPISQLRRQASHRQWVPMAKLCHAPPYLCHGTDVAKIFRPSLQGAFSANTRAVQTAQCGGPRFVARDQGRLFAASQAPPPRLEQRSKRCPNV